MRWKLLELKICQLRKVVDTNLLTSNLAFLMELRLKPRVWLVEINYYGLINMSSWQVWWIQLNLNKKWDQDISNFKFMIGIKWPIERPNLMLNYLILGKQLWNNLKKKNLLKRIQRKKELRKKIKNNQKKMQERKILRKKMPN